MNLSSVAVVSSSTMSTAFQPHTFVIYSLRTVIAVFSRVAEVRRPVSTRARHPVTRGRVTLKCEASA
jgi:hypothetical protein